MKDELLSSIMDYIDTHEDMNMLKEMCSEFHYSYSYLSHYFKNKTGVSLSEYYQQRRFEKAAELLRQEKYSITEIAKRVGYRRVNAFSKAFSRYHGISPTNYRLTQGKS